MKLVVDANILFSALLRKGLTRHLWFHPEVQLFAPEFILNEALSHQAELLKNTAERAKNSSGYSSSSQAK